MQKKLQTVLWIILIVVSGATVGLSQAPTPSPNTAETSRLTRIVPATVPDTNAPDDCEEKLETANQRLVKTLDAFEKAKAVIESLQEQIRIQGETAELRRQLDESKDRIIAQQAALIEILQKQQGRRLSILFGLIKLRF